MSKYKFIRFLACFFIMVGSLSLFIHSADANPPQIKPTRNLKLRPMPDGAYQVANIIFLPDADESIWLPNGNYNKNPCTKMGYKLTSCPEHGNCANCPMDPKYMKLTSCNNEYNQFYKVSSDGTSCQRYCYPQYCNTSTYFAVTCPEGTVCDMCKEIKDDCSEILHFKPTTNCQSGYYYSGGRCVRGCSVNSCSGYNLSSAPANATSVSCTIKNQDCSSGATKYKITSCNSGYNLSSDGLSCVQTCNLTPCSSDYNDSNQGIYFDGVYHNGIDKYNTCKDCNSTKYHIVSCKPGYRYYIVPDVPYSPQRAYCMPLGKLTNCETFGDLVYVNKNNPAEKICYSGLMSEEEENKYELIGYVANPKKRIMISGNYATYNYYYNAYIYRNEPGNVDIPEIPNEDLEWIKANGFKAKNKISGKVYTQQMNDYCLKNGLTCPAVSDALSYQTIGTKAGDWFIPSLYDIEEVASIDDATLRNYYCTHVFGIRCYEITTLNEVGNPPRFYRWNLENVYNGDRYFFETRNAPQFATYF